MTDPQRPLTRREARELRRQQEVAAQQPQVPEPEESTSTPADEPREAESRHGRRSAGTTQDAVTPASAPTRRHGRRRGDGPADGGVPRIPKLAPVVPESEPPVASPAEPIGADTEDRATPPAPPAPPIAAPKVASAPSPTRTEPEDHTQDDDETQLGLPAIVPGGRTQQPTVPSSDPAPLPPVPPSAAAETTEPTPVMPPAPPAPPEPAAAAPESPATPASHERTATPASNEQAAEEPPASRTESDRAREAQRAFSSNEPTQLDPAKLDAFEQERQRVVRSALGRAHQERGTEAERDASAASPSFAEVLGIGAPAPTEPPAKPLAPAVAPLDSPRQRALENTGLVSPVTSTVPVVFPEASSSERTSQAEPLQARQAHGLDPLEYRVSGVKRTRAGLTVVIASVVVAVGAVVLAINL